MSLMRYWLMSLGISLTIIFGRIFYLPFTRGGFLHCGIYWWDFRDYFIID